MDPCLYIVGGAASVDGPLRPQPFSCVDALNLQDPSWSQLPAMSVPRRGCATLTTEGKLFALGGTGPLGEPLASGEVFDFTQYRWSTLPAMKEPRKDFTAFVSDGKLFVFGGGDIDASLTSCEGFDLSGGDGWTM